MNIAFLKSLSEAPGVPGREERVRDVLQRATKRTRAAGAKRVLLACHIDEIGFYVKHVDDKGFVRVHNVGGFDTKNLSARRVLVQSSGGGGSEDLVGLMNPQGR